MTRWSGVYRDRYIFLIGGWSTAEERRRQQRPDIRHRQRYLDAGHADSRHSGVRSCGRHHRRHDCLRRWRLQESRAARIRSTSRPANAGWAKLPVRRRATSRKFEWSKTSPASRQRALSHRGRRGSRGKKAGKIYFSGGTDNPYNYNGIGYNGQPSEPSPVTFAFNVHSQRWETVSENTPDPTMDHRGLLVTHRGW